MSTFVAESENEINNITIDSPTGKTTITIQQYQHIYNQITGKSEQLSITSKKSIKVEVDDLKNLDSRIKQSLQQYRIVGFSERYSAFYTNDQKETSRDFDRFTLTAKAPASTTDSINFVYNFSITLPQLKEAQNYSISVRIINRWALRQKIASELPAKAPRRIINMLSAETAEIKIDYVDYSVARNITAIVCDWLEGLPSDNTHPLITWAQKRSHWTPKITKYITILLLSLGLHEYAPSILKETNTFAEFTQFLGIAGVITYFFISAGTSLGKYIEAAIDSIDEVSYIKLTRGDENAITEANNGKNNEIKKAIIGGVISAAFGIATRYAAKLLGIFY